MKQMKQALTLWMMSSWMAGTAGTSANALWEVLPHTPGRRLPPPGREAVANEMSVRLFEEKLDFSMGKDGYARVTLISIGGEQVEFRLTFSDTLPPSLREKYPEILSFSGESTGHVPPLQAQVDYSPYTGLHAQVFDGESYTYIDPYDPELQEYKVYRPTTISHARKHWNCGSDHLKHPRQSSNDGEESHSTDVSNRINSSQGTHSGRVKFVLALSGNQGYSSFHGDRVNSTLAAMTAIMSRVNGVYKRELGIFFQLHPENDKLICSSDSGFEDCPLSNSGDVIGENGKFISGRGIPASEFDLGHVFTTTAGGAAYLGSLCTSFKAGGYTGLRNPVGDAFAVDYVAHELGHQLNGEHTFLDCDGYFAGSFATAVEPGSGSTIMGYAGICGPTNLQDHSDPIFHSKNVEEILRFVTSKVRNGCGQELSSSETPPPINFPSSCKLPSKSFFQLGFMDTEEAGQEGLTYTIEPAEKSNVMIRYTSPSPSRFRAWLPSKRPFRTFPNMYSILSGTKSYDEVIPQRSELKIFRGTVRSKFSPVELPTDDEHTGGFGTIAWKDVQVTFDAGIQPLEITSTFTLQTIRSGEPFLLKWRTGGTRVLTKTIGIYVTELPTWRSAKEVDTLDWVKIMETANDGAETITVPLLDASTLDEISVVLMLRSLDDSCFFFDVVHLPSFLNKSPSPTQSPTTGAPTTYPTATPTEAPTSFPTQSPISFENWLDHFTRCDRSRNPRTCKRNKCSWQSRPRKCITDIPQPPTPSPTTAAPTPPTLSPTVSPTLAPTTAQDFYQREKDFCESIGNNRRQCNNERDRRRKKRCLFRRGSCFTRAKPPPTPSPTQAPSSRNKFEDICTTLRSRRACKRKGCIYDKRTCKAPPTKKQLEEMCPAMNKRGTCINSGCSFKRTRCEAPKETPEREKDCQELRGRRSCVNRGCVLRRNVCYVP